MSFSPLARSLRGLPLLGLLLALFLLSACASAGRLGEYDFPGRTVAVVTTAPPHPQVFTDDFYHPPEPGLVRNLLRLGSEVVREVQADRARRRMDQAVQNVDVAGRMADRALDRGVRLLRARPVAAGPEADFEMELRVKKYGIEADSWDAQAHFLIEAELFFFDARTGRRVWKGKVKEKDLINPSSWGARGTVGNLITARALAELSVEEIERTLEHLADYSADRMMEKFERGLEKARRR